MNSITRRGIVIGGTTLAGLTAINLHGLTQNATAQQSSDVTRQKDVFPLAGKIALVTGGARGIGRAIAVELARQGADVASGDVPDPMPQVHYAQSTQADMEETLRLVRAQGRRALGVQTDVRNEESIRTFVNRINKELGGLDIAVNNAAVNVAAKPLHELPTEGYDTVMNTNLRGLWLSMKYEIPVMLSRGKGSIINISSDQGQSAGQNISAYIASKHGVIGATRAAAMDYSGQGIRVNCVAPGPTDTAQFRSFVRTAEERQQFAETNVPIKRIAQPEEMGGIVAWLSSDAASYVTGAVFEIDGGYTASA